MSIGFLKDKHREKRIVVIISLFIVLVVLCLKTKISDNILAKDNAEDGSDKITIVFKYKEDQKDNLETLDRQVKINNLSRQEAIEDKYDIKKDTEDQIRENKEKYPKRAKRVAKNAVAPDLSLVKEIKVKPVRADKVLEKLQNDNRIEYAYIKKESELLPEIPLAVPNDTIYNSTRSYKEGLTLDPNQSYHLRNMGLNPTDDDSTESGWDTTTGLDTVTVAIYGWSGFDFTHPDLEENVWLNPGEFPESVYSGLDGNSDGVITASELKNWPEAPLADWNNDQRINLKDLFVVDEENLFLDNIDTDGNGYVDDFIGWDSYLDSNNLWDDGATVGGHDTLSAGIVGAIGNNSFGMTGINWKVRLMAVDGDYSNAIVYATNNGADVVDISYSGQGISDKTAVDYAWANGTIVVFAAGNSNSEIPLSINRSDKTWLIGGVKNDNNKASWSDWGKRLDFSAPGYAIYTTTVDYLQDPASIPLAPYPKMSYQSDRTGKPSLIYYDYERDKLILGTYSDSSWSYETISEGKYIGLYPSLAYDSTNIPHVSAYDWDDRKLVYYTKIGSEWQETVITNNDDQGYFSQIKINGSDKPVIAYIDRTDKLLELATFSSSWTIEDVVSIGNFDLTQSRIGLGFGPNGDAQLAFYHKTNGDLGYAIKSDGLWSATYPDTTGNVGAYLDVAFDNSSRPRIVYTDIDNWNTKLATYDGVSWTVETVLSTGKVGYYDNQIAIKSDNSAVISTPADTSRLYYLWYDGSTWQNEAFGVDQYLGAVHELGLQANNPYVYSFSWHRGLYQATKGVSWTYNWMLDYGVNYTYGSGTSFAAPQIAGAAALLIGNKPTWRLDQIYWLLASTATHFGSPGWHEIYRGWGVPNLQAALAVATPLSDDSAPTAGITSPENGASVNKGIITISGTSSDVNLTYYNLYYKRHSSSTWSFISGYNRTAVENNTLASWDTTYVTDGDYDIRLEVSDWYQTASADIMITVGLGEPTPTPTNTLTPTPTTTPVIPTSEPRPTEEAPTITPSPTPTPDFIITDITATPSTDSAIISWKSSITASSQVEYGLTDSYGDITLISDTLPVVFNHNVNLSSLLACTNYHYRVRSKEIEGIVPASVNPDPERETISTDQTFNTTGCTGNSAVLSHTELMVNNNNGATVLLNHNGRSIALTVPVDFYNTEAKFEIKQLDKSSVIGVTGNPLGFSPSNLVYSLQAISGDNAITPFNKPITIKINYNYGDIVGLNEGSLSVYRWDGSSWHALTDCSVDVNSLSISCTTTSFSTFMLFGKENIGSGNASNSNNTPSSTTDAPVCNNQVPSSVPYLFQITTSNNVATLYFVPAGNPVNKYFISFGKNMDNLEYGVEYDQGPSGGVLVYTINLLSPNTLYYFKIRGGNGCMPGQWSNFLGAKTTAIDSQRATYYPGSAFVTEKITGQATMPVVNNKLNNKQVLSQTDKINEDKLIVVPTPVNIRQETTTYVPPNYVPTPVNKKKCFLFWCW